MKEFPVGTYTNLDGGWNDQISSIKVGANVRVKLCEHGNCAGSDWYNALELVGPYNENFMVGVNDWVSYIEVTKYDPINEPRVQLFGSSNYDLNRAGTFLEGVYTTADLKNMHIDRAGYNGAASGISVPYGLTAWLFKRDDCDPGFNPSDYMSVVGPENADFT
jgi:hypothetical protein